MFDLCLFDLDNTLIHTDDLEDICTQGVGQQSSAAYKNELLRRIARRRNGTVGFKGGGLHPSRAALDYGRWLAMPEPTQLGADNSEPKVQANVLIAAGDVAKMTELLMCSMADVWGGIVMRSRDDYPKLLCARSSSPEVGVMPQVGLL